MAVGAEKFLNGDRGLASVAYDVRQRHERMTRLKAADSQWMQAAQLEVYRRPMFINGRPTAAMMMMSGIVVCL